MTTSRTTTAPPRLGPDEIGSYRDFKLRMGLRILQNGGSEQDVMAYWDHLDAKPGVQTALESPVAVTRQDQGLGKVPSWLGIPMHFIQGATFGFGDDAFGSLSGVLAPGMTTQEGRDNYRAVLEEFARTNPKATVASQIAGAVATGVATGGVTGASLTGVRGMAAGAGVGAGAAALTGAGNATGGVGQRVQAATDPGALGLGAAGGAVAGPLLRGAGRTVSAVARPAIRATKEAATQVAGAIEGILQRIPGSPARQARAALREALEADGITPAQAVQAVRSRLARGNAVTVGDIGGSNVGALITNAQKFQGPVQQSFSDAVRLRIVDASPRSLSELARQLRLGTTNVYDLVEQTLAVQSFRSDPLYQQAYQQTVKLTPRLKALLGNPDMRRAYESGRVLAMAEDLTGPRGLAIPALGDDLPDDLPLRALDYVKKGINHLTQTTGADGKPALSRQMSRAMGRAVREALTDIDPQVPVYGQARAMFRGYEEVLEAVEDGYGGAVTRRGLESGGAGFLSKTPQEIARDLNALDPSLKPWYRMGAVQAIADAINGAGEESVQSVLSLTPKTLFNDRAMMGRIAALFDDPSAARQFADFIAGEATIARVAQAARPRSPEVKKGLHGVTPQGRVGTVVSRFTGGRRDVERGQMLADEIVALYMRGADDPNDLIALLESLNNLGRAPLGRTALTPGEAGAARVVAGQQSR